jgi:mannose-6-phosphate isomerase-like protein (cupin superfamily)
LRRIARVPAPAVVHPDDVEPRREGSAELRTTFDASNGCERLEQRVVRLSPGRSEPRGTADTQEILYVVSGRGSLELDGKRYELEPDMGVFIAAGESYVIDAAEQLELLSVLTRAAGPPAVTRRVTVRFADQPELEASPERTFRYLVDEDAGCTDVTQFLGIVQPSKAPFHSHRYDEVGYIVEGEGIAHVDGEQTPLRRGSCFHLAPGQVHCIENTGTRPMRIVGVFHPSGSPASRDDADNN